MTTFQTETDYAQSVVLKELGAPQDIDSDGDPLWGMRPGRDVGPRLMLEIDRLKTCSYVVARAFTFEQMYFALLGHFKSMSLDVIHGETELALWRPEPMQPGDPEEYRHPIAPVFASGPDPFAAVYDAYCWMLKQGSSNPQP